jgi:hypothetical protein
VVCLGSSAAQEDAAREKQTTSRKVTRNSTWSFSFASHGWQVHGATVRIWHGDVLACAVLASAVLHVLLGAVT